MGIIFDLVRHNFRYKLFAFLLACIFWYIVQGQEIVEVNRKIQVFISPPKGYMVRGSSVQSKDITISGSRAHVGDYATRPLEANIIIPEGSSGKLRFRLGKEYFSQWNPRVKLTIHDAYITVNVDEKLKRNIPVKVNIQGLPGDGYIVEKILAKPANVRVTGPKPEVSNLQHLVTEPIDISGIRISQTFPTTLLHQNNCKLVPNVVSVSVQVGEKKENRRFDKIPIELPIQKSRDDEGHPIRYDVDPKYVTIVLQGTSGILNFVKKDAMQAFLNIPEDLADGTYQYKIQVKIPQNSVLIELVPEVAHVSVVRSSPVTPMDSHRNIKKEIGG